MKLVGKTKEQVEQERLKRLAEQVRAERNRKLAETDWMVLTDAPIDEKKREAILRYRQALRDLPQQKSFPLDIKWPELGLL
ncbi:TPA: hypothetical protein ENX78_08485 [Candidatus Poribacteria bacterium]|nr:hypothetical protein [Candidatus Poribacteria bacterium]